MKQRRIWDDDGGVRRHAGHLDIVAFATITGRVPWDGVGGAKGSQLQSAMQSAFDVFINTQGAGVDPSAISQQLAPDQATYQAAAATASSLAAKAPTALTNDVTTDTENVRERLTTFAAAFTGAAKQDASQLGSLDSSQFDEGSTGCEFGSSGPDGKVSKLFGS